MPRSHDTTTGWMFVGAYACLVIGSYAMFASSSDMGGLVVVVFALPWSALGNALAGHTGLVAGTYGGLVVNAIAAYLIGRHLWPRVLHGVKRRMAETERFREQQG